MDDNNAGKTERAQYLNLNQVLALIRRFETDEHTNALVPLALAHNHTTISTIPGEKVLDIVSQGEFSKKR